MPLKAAAETLRAELGLFNIRVIVFEPGFFKTPFIEPGRVVMPAPSRLLEPYKPYHDAQEDWRQIMVGNQRGDVKKAVELMIDVIRGEGCATGREFPPRLPLGPDAISLIEVKCRETLELIDLWRKEVSNTDRDDYQELS